ncbi:MAG: hypothetical protein L6V93_18500 [Clostridiales bacterium]|nr:MAG: hypothetical protein L6V93_18500 [Clostridiales bacterium]
MEKYEYKNVENYQVNVFPSNLENPSFTMNFDEKATVYIEQDGRFKYGVRVRSAKFENGGEARYLPETGEIYLIHEKGKIRRMVRASARCMTMTETKFTIRKPIRENSTVCSLKTDIKFMTAKFISTVLRL